MEATDKSSKHETNTYSEAGGFLSQLLEETTALNKVPPA